MNLTKKLPVVQFKILVCDLGDIIEQAFNYVLLE